MCEIQQQKITFVNVLFHLDLTLQLLRAIRVSGKSKEKSESTKKVHEKFGRKGKIYLTLHRYCKRTPSMNTNLTTASSPISAKYWKELKGLSDNVKLELITLLSSSMTHPEKENAKAHKGWASRFAGVWQDSRSAEEIVADVQAARTNNSFNVEL